MIKLVMHTKKNDMVFHIEKIGMLRLVVEIDVDGMIADVVDKLTCSFDDLQLEQVDQKRKSVQKLCVHLKLFQLHIKVLNKLSLKDLYHDLRSGLEFEVDNSDDTNGHEASQSNHILQDENASAERTSLPDHMDHICKEVSALHSKLRDMESSIVQQVSAEIKSSLPALITTAFKEQLPRLLSATLKECLPLIIQESLQTYILAFSEQVTDSSFFKKNFPKVLKSETGQSVTSKVHLGMEEIRDDVNSQTKHLQKYCLSVMDRETQLQEVTDLFELAVIIDETAKGEKKKKDDNSILATTQGEHQPAKEIAPLDPKADIQRDQPSDLHNTNDYHASSVNEDTTQEKKLGLPPVPELAIFRMTAEDKKRKRTEFLKELFVKERIERESKFYITSIVQLIRLLKHINQDSPEAKEMCKIVEIEIESRDDVNKARENLSAKHQLVVKGLSKCKASKSNIRRIQVKDVVKEVKDYLKTYSLAGLDISWGVVTLSRASPECPRRVPPGQTKKAKPSTRKEESNTRRSRKTGRCRHHEGSPLSQLVITPNGFDASLILTNPKGIEFTYALRFRFNATNNEAEYEALIAGLRIAEQMGVKNLQVNVDSRLVANQVNGSYIAKESGMVQNLEKSPLDRRIPLNLKGKFYKVAIRPAMLYGSEYWPVTKAQANRVEVEELRMPKWTCGRTMVDMISNGVFRGALEVDSKINKMREGRLRWFGHVKGDRKLPRDNPLKDWYVKLCINQHFASVKHPQANGLVERVNRSLGEGIKAQLYKRRKDWIEEIPHVLWEHRTMIKSSNGDTLFSLTYKTEAVIPAEIGMPALRTTEIDLMQNDEALEINLDLLEEREKAAIREAMRKANMGKYYNSKVRNTSFKPGDLVHQNNDASHVKDSEKLIPKLEGPYKVIEALGKGAYMLRDSYGKLLPRTWNICNLKKCYVH
uniref:Reverse transcriptase domain-containing protein n=1 Tax=Tanacetum cinerariifolium TaxID=118510 RepID=A0A6L2LG67_TANCI|nr:reverse transcriptase domain-containing protein [Tanacetum cinerariifolium]